MSKEGFTKTEKNKMFQLLRCAANGGSGGATEQTLTAVLAAIQSSANTIDIEGIYIKDVNGIVWYHETTTNQTTGVTTEVFTNTLTGATGTPTTPYQLGGNDDIDIEKVQLVANPAFKLFIYATNDNGTIVYRRVSDDTIIAQTDFEPCDPPSDCSFDLEERWYDNSPTNGDLLIGQRDPIWMQVKIDNITGLRTPNAYYEIDTVTPYPVADINRVYREDELGLETNTNYVRYDLAPGMDWIVPAGIISFTIKVHSYGDTTGDPLLAPTITTYADPTDATTQAATIRVSRLREFEIAGVSREEDTIQIQEGMIIKSNHPNDDITIEYTHYVTV